MRLLGFVTVLLYFTFVSATPTVPITVDFDTQKPVSPILFGAFFEEINHAGDGGLYAELIQDRSFDFSNLITGLINLQSNISPLFMRHCAEDGLVYGTGVDHNYNYSDVANSGFYIQAALNGNNAAHAVSFQSYDSPGYYLRVNSTNGLAFLDMPTDGDNTFNGDASFLLLTSQSIGLSKWDELSLPKETKGATLPDFTNPFHDFPTAASPIYVVSQSQSVYFNTVLTVTTGTTSNCSGVFSASFPVLSFLAPRTDSDGQMWTVTPPTQIIDSPYTSPWTNFGNAVSMATSNSFPLNSNNVISLCVNTTLRNTGVSTNGYWGIPTQNSSFELNLYAFSPSGTPPVLTAMLMSSSGGMIYASASAQLSNSWTQYQLNLVTSVTDPQAMLVLTWNVPSTVYLDVVSLFNSLNVEQDIPFNLNLLGMLKQMAPRFLRFPGGNYIEGNLPNNYYHWEETVGPIEQRPGHFNDAWGYWSTDGLGYYEFLILCEMLNAQPVWVVYNGCGLTYSMAPSTIQPLIDDALASLEFAMGDTSTKWGSLRASMGHPDPFSINYMAIGNEDYGHEYYIENYNLFYGAIHAMYPNIMLIANWNLIPEAPTMLYDFHIYPDPSFFIDNQFYWDSVDRTTNPLVFNSEYAVVTGAGDGNLWAAVAEACWMTGLERNSDLVIMASYAPLFCRVDEYQWQPNAINYDSYRVYGTPSYWNQVLFSQYQGVYVFNFTSSVDPTPVAFSAVCTDKACAQVVYKIVNYQNYSVSVQISLDNAPMNIEPSGQLVTLTGNSLLQENTLSDPLAVSPHTQLLNETGNVMNVTLVPNSINFVLLTTSLN